MNMKLDVWLMSLLHMSIIENSWIKHIGNLLNFSWRIHDWNLAYNPQRLLGLWLTHTRYDVREGLSQ